eukprot:2946831-Amphidinium_carterae.1
MHRKCPGGENMCVWQSGFLSFFCMRILVVGQANLQIMLKSLWVLWFFYVVEHPSSSWQRIKFGGLRTISPSGAIFEFRRFLGPSCT